MDSVSSAAKHTHRVTDPKHTPPTLKVKTPASARDCDREAGSKRRKSPHSRPTLTIQDKQRNSGEEHGTANKD